MKKLSKYNYKATNLIFIIYTFLIITKFTKIEIVSLLVQYIGRSK